MATSNKTFFRRATILIALFLLIMQQGDIKINMQLKKGERPELFFEMSRDTGELNLRWPYKCKTNLKKRKRRKKCKEIKMLRPDLRQIEKMLEIQESYRLPIEEEPETQLFIEPSFLDGIISEDNFEQEMLRGYEAYYIENEVPVHRYV